MMGKQILAVSIFFLSLAGTEVRAQEHGLDSLNYFKYAIVKTLFYDDNTVVDKYSISGNVRKHFIDKGFRVVTETKRYWPEELFKNPCMAVYCDIQTSSGMFTKYKVLIKMKDCNGHLIYSTLGKGTGDTEKDAYKMATERALYDFDKWEYHYIPGKTVRLREKLVKKKLDGLYEALGEYEGLKIEISSDSVRSTALILQPGIGKWKEGEVLATFKSSSLSKNLYNVQWMPGSPGSYETLASLAEDAGRLTVELKENGQTKQIVFRKIE